MSQGNVSSSQLTLSGTGSSSKTVAAILKQVKEQQGPKETVRKQQQVKTQCKKIIHGTEQTLQSSNILSHLNMSKGSPLCHMGLPSAKLAAVPPTCVRSLSPIGKEHSPVTSKSSSLSRELSLSHITAQMVKVMADSSTATTMPNLLRSALQGNMLDAMGILSSKTEGGLVTVVTSKPGSHFAYNPLNGTSPASISYLSPGSNSISDSHHQRHTFKKILTSVAGVAGYLAQEDIGLIDSKSSTVENLLASTDGTIQTVNVSHIPKSMSENTINGSLSGSTSSLQATAARASQISAMEVAQQIRMEANGQKSSAQLAALQPGMQQQLRSQIQSSRSIDAQLTPNLTSVGVSKGQSVFQRTHSKEPEQKALDTTVPLLASRLAPSAASPAVATLVTSSAPSQLKQQHHMTGESSVLSSGMFVSSSLSFLPSSLPPTSSISMMGRKSDPPVSLAKPHKKPLMQHQQQHNPGNPQQHNPGNPQQYDLRSQLQPKGVNLTEAKELHAETVVSNNHAGIHSQSQQQIRTALQSAVMNQGELYSGLDEQQVVERLIKQSCMKGSLTDMSAKVDSHVQTVAKQLYPQYTGQKSSTETSLKSLCHTKMRQMDQDLTDSTTAMITENSGQMLNGTSTIMLSRNANTVSKNTLGECKQSSLDIGLDIGQLASITGDGASIHLKLADSSAQVVKINGALHSDLGHQFCSTSVPAVSDSESEQTSTKSKYSQTFVPVQTVKSSPTFTLHSLKTTSSLSHIPSPIMLTSSSLSLPAATSTAHPPPTDYMPPPPYPARLNQQFQPELHKQQVVTTKTGRADKHFMQNPFTFPTTGVRVHPDSESIDQLSHSFTSAHSNISNNSNDIKQELCSSFAEPEACWIPHSSCQSETSTASSGHGNTCPILHSDMPKVFPEVCNMQEVSKGSDNHMEEVSEEIKRQPVVQPFNQRISNLSCFPVMNSTYRAAYRSHVVAVQRAKSGVITDTSKSLDILRKNLQPSINKEISDVIKRYIDKYFLPALENVKQNTTVGFVEEEHINCVCRQILEEAKTLYTAASDRRSVTLSDAPDNLSESGSLGGRRMFLKRSRVSDSDSEKGSDTGFKRKPLKKKGRTLFQGSGRTTPLKTFKSGEPVRRHGPKWDPERLKSDTLFVMGARANKALGLGNMRGRLYIRHPDVFKYIGDQEDKLWLCEHNLMPATGGKAYMLLLKDIEDLSVSDDYKDSPGLMMHECVGFAVPEWMLVKIKDQMKVLRSDSSKRSPSQSPSSNVDPKNLPFSSFAESIVKEETMMSDAEKVNFLSVADNGDIHPSSAISPFTIECGFEDSSSEHDHIEDPQPVSSLFS